MVLLVCMSKNGEIADRILDLLSKNEKLGVKQLKKKIPSANSEILSLMKDAGLIELKNDEITITEFGSELRNVV